jgi:hypothetical protein
LVKFKNGQRVNIVSDSMETTFAGFHIAGMGEGFPRLKLEAATFEILVEALNRLNGHVR